MRKCEIIDFYHLHELSLLNSVGTSLEKQMKHFTLIKSKQEKKYSLIKSVKLLLVLSRVLGSFNFPSLLQGLCLVLMNRIISK